MFKINWYILLFGTNQIDTISSTLSVNTKKLTFKIKRALEKIKKYKSMDQSELTDKQIRFMENEENLKEELFLLHFLFVSQTINKIESSSS